MRGINRTMLGVGALLLSFSVIMAGCCGAGPCRKGKVTGDKGNCCGSGQCSMTSGSSEMAGCCVAGKCDITSCGTTCSADKGQKEAIK